MSATLQCIDCSDRFWAKRSDALRCLPCKDINRVSRQKQYETRRKESCPNCEGTKVRGSNLCRVCDNKARVGQYVGNANPNWREGRSNWKGYIYVRVRTGSMGGQAYRPEHHLVWEATHGKPLPQGWVVHHLNGVKDDNRPENLAAMPRNEHHTHPREALHPYEERIKELETEPEIAWEYVTA